MDENANVAPPTPSVAPVQEGLPVQSSVKYGSFLGRFLALLVDAIAFAAVFWVIDSVFGFKNQLVTNLLVWTYFVVMDVQFGATLGKMALGLRVQNVNSGKNLTWLEAILREVVGKFLSCLGLMLGFLWVLWDPKKQAWHDKLASSVVVKVAK